MLHVERAFRCVCVRAGVGDLGKRAHAGGQHALQHQHNDDLRCVVVVAHCTR